MNLDNFTLIFNQTSDSINQTRLVGERLSSLIKAGQIVGFVGELGAGKTELIRAICLALGDDSMVSSPTYTLENQYKFTSGASVLHWDLYRLKSIDGIAAELNEQKDSQKSLILVEWPELIADLLDMLVLVSSADSGTRNISLYSRVS